MTWDIVPLLIAIDVESGVYIGAACLPTLCPLLLAITNSSLFKKVKKCRRTSTARIQGDKILFNKSFESPNTSRRLDDESCCSTRIETDNAAVQMPQQQQRTSIRETDVERRPTVPEGRIGVMNTLEIQYNSRETLEA